MRDHSHHIELTREDAVKGMIEALPETFGIKGAQKNIVEHVDLAHSFGRILAEDITARLDMPSALTCCMDSIAVHWSDFENLAQNELPNTSNWVRGKDWQFANTGIAMPQGFDTAIVIEHVEVSEDEQHVKILAKPSKQYAGTRQPGSNLHKGDLLAKTGDVITPEIAARIAGGNYACVPVIRKPRVAFIPTGNELITPGSSYPEIGKNFETNSIVVRGKVESWGGTFVPFDIVADIPKKITEAVEKACQIADIVVLNAGSSKGSDDWSIEQLEEMGQIICHQTKHGPGHHSSYALVNDTPIVGISGPAGGASTTLNFYLLPVMRYFFGHKTEPCTVAAKLTKEFPASKHIKAGAKNIPGETRPSVLASEDDIFYAIKPLYLELGDDGTMYATPVPGRPGSMQSAKANAYCLIGKEKPKKGDIVLAEWR